jgi:phenylalanyl-tRNA synthetase beta chain
MKGVVEDWLERRGFGNVPWTTFTSPAYKHGAAAAWIIKGTPIVSFGEAAPELTKGFRMRNPLFIAQFEVARLMAMSKSTLKYTPIPQFPGTSRDVSFVAPSDLTHAKIVSLIEGLKLQYFEKVQIFDIFEDEKVLGPGRRSLAYNITFRNPERTMTDEEANALQDKVRAALAAIPGVELR